MSAKKLSVSCVLFSGMLLASACSLGGDAGEPSDMEEAAADPMREIACIDFGADGKIEFLEPEPGSVIVITTLDPGKYGNVLQDMDFAATYEAIMQAEAPAELAAMSARLHEAGGGGASIGSPGSGINLNGPGDPASGISAGRSWMDVFTNNTGILNAAQFLDWLGYGSDNSWAYTNQTTEYHWKGKCSYLSVNVNVYSGQVDFRFRVRYTPLFGKDYWRVYSSAVIANGVTVGAACFNYPRKEVDLDLDHPTGYYHFGGSYVH